MRVTSWLSAVSKTIARKTLGHDIRKKRESRRSIGWLERLEDRRVLSTFYVSLTGNDTSGNGTIATPYRSIQKALDIASLDATSPHTINVAAGTYNQLGFDNGFGIGNSASPTPNLNGLTLNGGWNATFTTQTVGSTVYIPQTNINNSTPSPFTQDIGIYNTGVTVRGFTFVFDGQLGDGGTRKSGGILTEATYTVITQNTVEVGYSDSSARSVGIVVHTPPGGGTSTGVQVTNNTVVANAGSTYAFLNDSTGILVNPETTPGRISPIIISGNYISGPNLGTGITVDKVSYVTIDGNTIERTGSAAVSQVLIALKHSTGVDTYSSIPQTGIIISNNTLDGLDGSAPGSIGIDLSARGAGEIQQVSGVSITGNVIRDVALGVFSNRPTVLGSGINATSNAFTGITNKAVAFSGTGNMNASGNWYGSNVLATVNGLISGTVDYSPYLNLGTDASGAVGFQPTYSSLTVVSTGAQTGASGRIQEAVGLLTAGGTINIGAGTYAENVSVNKNLSLIGNSPSDTFINGGSGVGVSIINPTTAVTLQNLKIAGNPTAISNTTSPTLATVTLNNVLLFDAGAATTTITGTSGNDALRIALNGTILETYLGASLIDSRPLSSVPSLVVNGGGGDDVFTIDLSGGNLIPAGGITFNGGTDAGGGDKLVVTGGTTTTVTHSFTNNNDGQITLAGAIGGTINYTGLEPITDNVNAANRVFTFTGAAETITVTDAAGAFTRIDSTLGEFVDFAAPTASLTIITNGGDTATISSFDAAFNTPNIILQDTTAASTFSLGAGNIIPDATTLTVVGSAVFNLAGFSETIDGLAGSGTIDNSTGTSTLTAGSSGATSVFSGILRNVGGALGLTKIGAGVLTLSNGSNAYSGITNVNGGTLAVTANNALGTNAGGTVVAAAGILDLQGVTYLTTEGVTLDGGTLQVSTGTSSFAGTVTLSTATSTINVSGTQLTLSGQLTGTQGFGKTGAGTLILTNATNDYAGATTVSVGTLAVTANNALGGVAGNTVVGATGTLDLRGVTYAAAEPLTLNGGTLQTSTGTSSLAGAITLTADSIVNVSGTQLTLSGQITGAAGLDITKTGTGTLILTNAANSYAGDTNISAGTVQINGTNGGTGAVNVNGSSILRGIGTIGGAVNVNGTARLAPGIAGPGTLTMASVAFSTTSFLDIDINGATAGTQYDQLVVSGTVNLGGANGATLTPTIGGGYDPATFYRFTIINQTGGGVVSGTFEGHPEGGIYEVSGERLRVSYIESLAPYGDGNDVSLTVLPPPIIVTYTANGNLRLEGTEFVDDIIIDFSNTNSVTLIGNGFTNFSGSGTNGQIAGPYLVTGTINVNTNGENDVVVLRGLTANARLDSGDININLGAGDDTLTTVHGTTPTLGLTMTGNISIVGGTGVDNVRLGSNAANDTFTALNVSIDNGTGSGAQSINLDRFTANGNVTLTNTGTGAQTVALGQNASNAANSIRGDLTIKQNSTATSFTVGIRNTSVGGLLSVINGSGTGAAAVTINTTTAQTIGGTTSITNGDNVTNSVSLVGTTGGLQSTGNITIKNGVGSTSNSITVTDLGASGTSSNTFTNGASPANSITMNGTTGNAFTGFVGLTNGTSTGTNAITVTRLSSTKGLTLTNGDATTSIDVTIGGSLATSLVNVTGNVALTNGTSADIDVDIDNLTVLGANAAGNLTITNDATGAGGTTITFGANAVNAISGNLQITNQSSSGTRAVTLNRTTVSGRTGFNLYQLSSGNTTLTVGNVSTVTVSKGFVVQDGTGDATVNLQRLTTGSLNYTDAGGGVDTMDLGGTPVGTLQVNGVARIETGLGSDIVRVGGVGGTAMFNDSVFILLGSGDDNLTIGANALCSAFSNIKFHFDGGAGDDFFTGSVLSLPDYSPTTPLPKKVRSKIAGFEHLA